MLTRILHNSDQLHSFFNELGLDLTLPQQQHMLNMADALLVCEDTKTLAALQRQFVQAPDASNMADFLRISPWQAHDVRDALRICQVSRLLASVKQSDTLPHIYINMDDSLGEKDKATRHIQVVDWHYDHSESTKNKPRYKNAFCYLVCTMRVGTQTATVDIRLYLREKTVRRLNRKRGKKNRLPFRSKYRIARTILEQLRPLLPKGWKVVVQFDSWYASARLIKYCRRHSWHVTCGLKCNRLLSGKRVDKHAQELRHKWYTKVVVTTTDGINPSIMCDGGMAV
ncbi:MAG: transposase [Anaerolineales bacterium]|nr:transposase [Anaerolineales bacterium]